MVPSIHGKLLFLLFINKHLYPVSSMSKIDLYTESFEKQGNKQNYNPQDEATLVQDDAYLRMFGDNHALPKQKLEGWEPFGEDLDGEVNRGDMGQSLSLSYDGKTLVACGAFHAHVYRMHGGQWLLARDFSDDLDPGRGFYSVSLSSNGKRLALGASNNDGQGTDSGYVKVFEQHSDWSWTQIGPTLHGEGGDLFGNSLALSDDGNILVVGAYGGGYVDVFQYMSSTRRWKTIDKLEGKASDGFGFSVAVSGGGNRVAVGAPWGNENKGFMRLYDIASLDFVVEFDGDYFGDHFGHSVSFSMNGMRAAVGAFGASYVRVYDYDEDNNLWSKVGFDISFRDLAFGLGESVSLNEEGNLIAVGAPWGDYSGPLSGQSDVYELINDDWEKIGPSLYGTGVNDLFGKAVMLSGNGKKLAIGCPGCDTSSYNAGSVKVFSVPGSTTFDDDDFSPSMSPSPSSLPSLTPSLPSSSMPSSSPSILSSKPPSLHPSMSPSTYPTLYPSNYPSKPPTFYPSPSPTWKSSSPSASPSMMSSNSSTEAPSVSPVAIFFKDGDIEEYADFSPFTFQKFFLFFYRASSIPLMIMNFCHYMRIFAWWIS